MHNFAAEKITAAVEISYYKHFEEQGFFSVKQKDKSLCI